MKLGLVGWRGMVGSVLVERMLAEKDFDHCTPFLFTTSQAGQASPYEWAANDTLLDAYDFNALMEMDALIVTQGSDYTQKVYQDLYQKGWQGYWIDAASHLRMDNRSEIVLDPINANLIKDAIRSGTKTFVGGNCTVSLMLMAIDGLVRRDLVEWIIPMTYQAASGAGAKSMAELINQMGSIYQTKIQASPSENILAIEKQVTHNMQSEERFPQSEFGVPLGGSLIPWIDSVKAPGLSKEEWKAEVETNKILGREASIGVDGLCVRVGTLRCHSQALTLKLKEDLSISEVEEYLKEGNEWVRYVENSPEASKKYLTPASISGGLDIAVGRLRKLSVAPNMYSIFTVGDQLLWGAAEPLRRVLRLVLSEK